MTRYTDYFRGKALQEFPDHYIIVDVETTGLDPAIDKLIEISAVKYRFNRKVDEYVTFIYIDEPIPTRITKLTGITDEMLEDAPNPREALIGFLDFIGDDILIGYNITFDLAFLGVSCSEYCRKRLYNNYVDVLKIATDKLPFLMSRKQIDVAKYFGINIDGSHRALTDCEICNDCYQKLKELSIEEYTAPQRQKQLLVSSSAHNQRPFLGRRFFFIGVMDQWYINNFKDIIISLGGSVDKDITEDINIVVVGTADTGIVKTEDFRRLLEMKNAGAKLSLIKDISFVKTLLDRKYVINEEDMAETQIGLF